MKQNNALLYGVIGALIGGAIVWFLAANAVNNNMTSMMQMMGIRSQNIVGNPQDNRPGMMGNIDRHFIEQMIPHHEDAIAMADIALQKTQRPEIKSLANDIKRTQSAEIEQMRNWYKDWFGTDVPKNTAVVGMHGMMGGQDNFEELTNASDFDKAFIEEMVRHHEMAVMMATMLKNSTTRSEMKDLAQNIIDAQTKEINNMRGWYKAWGY